MAFLDNSGDIILDAVLTEAGRRRMANGDFSITKFALGDDEIDYSLYNKNHPSGSAYYDLTILQTPVFEAMTQVNAGINYGLLKNTSTDLLYLPVMKTNELSILELGNIAKSSGVFYTRDTGGDTGNDAANNIVAALNGDSIQSMAGTDSSTNYVALETGLDTGFGNIPAGTKSNRQSYLTANNLIDNTLYVFVDSRFFTNVLGVDSGATNFANDDGDAHGLNAKVNLINGTATDLTIGLDNYVAYKVETVGNEIYNYSASNTEEVYSVIGGPRGIFGAVSLVVKSGLDAEYTLYGTTNNSTLLSGATVNYIDTTIYVQGASTSAQVQIPVRIIRIA
jgi:hypothetical protein